MSRRTRNPFQLKSLGKVTKPFLNMPKNILRTSSSTVNSISSKLSMPYKSQNK